ncbi:MULTISPECIES: hypothetical protein [unclassified Aliivibrio]|uniref:hypothetical protein n=1 Tax=unclassified Aliivibrio TaxID=2645654 RepID=UPI001147A79F|nr:MULTISPECIES: hypothetical protein [unclassified Aliivibrio]
MNKIKIFFRRVTPKIIWNFFIIIKRIFSINRSIPLSFLKFGKQKNKIIALGNGPSLSSDMEAILSKVTTNEFDVVCVNNFACSEYFVMLKPSKYVLIDEYYFSPNAHVSWKEQRTTTFKHINEFTTWDMTIFVPAVADLDAIKSIIKNPLVKIIKLRVAGIDLGANAFNKLVYNTGFFGPYQVNVLIYAIYISIWAKYSEIEIYGADMSFHKNVDVDQSSNELIIKFTHFNDQSHIEKFNKNPEKIEPFTMVEFLELTYKTFRAHEILESYSISKKCKIKNMSNYSLIDSYSRPGLNNDKRK